MGVIYKIVNNVNNKVYIGQTMKKPADRWQCHKHRAELPEFKTHLYNAMRKYGVENFSFEIIEECCNDILDDRERFWIQHYKSYTDGYNETLGGQDAKRKYSYEDICYLLLQGDSKEEVADFFHCDKRTVYNASVSVLGKTPSQIAQEIFDSQVKYLYTEEGYNIKQIGSMLGCRYDKIKKSLNRQKIKTKSMSESKKTPFTKNVYQKIGNKTVKVYKGIPEASFETKIPYKSIFECLSGRARTAYGYRWDYHE